MTKHSDDLAVLDQLIKISLDDFASIIILPFFSILGESLLLRVVPKQMTQINLITGLMLREKAHRVSGGLPGKKMGLTNLQPCC